MQISRGDRKDERQEPEGRSRRAGRQETGRLNGRSRKAGRDIRQDRDREERIL